MKLHKPDGYTLVEILVVMLIISIVTSVGLLSIRYNDNKRMESIANEITQLFMLAEEQAMLQPATYGVIIDNKTLQFTQLQHAEKQTTWQPLQDHVFKQQVMPGDIEMQLKIKNADSSVTANNQPQVIISENGDITPFTLYIGKQGEKPKYSVVGYSDGSVIFNAI